MSEALSALLECSVTELDIQPDYLRGRVIDALRNHDIERLDDLVRLTERDILRTLNLASGSLRALKEALARTSPPLSLGMSLPSRRQSGEVFPLAGIEAALNRIAGGIERLVLALERAG
jgi:DNA-directed RNA polymerase alpha subunit